MDEVEKWTKLVLKNGTMGRKRYVSISFYIGHNTLPFLYPSFFSFSIPPPCILSVKGIFWPDSAVQHYYNRILLIAIFIYISYIYINSLYWKLTRWLPKTGLIWLRGYLKVGLGTIAEPNPHNINTIMFYINCAMLLNLFPTRVPWDRGPALGRQGAEISEADKPNIREWITDIGL